MLKDEICNMQYAICIAYCILHIAYCILHIAYCINQKIFIDVDYKRVYEATKGLIDGSTNICGSTSSNEYIVNVDVTVWHSASTTFILIQ
jgi:hypothetical protein